MLMQCLGLECFLASWAMAKVVALGCCLMAPVMIAENRTRLLPFLLLQCSHTAVTWEIVCNLVIVMPMVCWNMYQ